MLLPEEHYRKRSLEGLCMTILGASLAIGFVVLVGIELKDAVEALSASISNGVLK